MVHYDITVFSVYFTTVWNPSVIGKISKSTSVSTCLSLPDAQLEQPGILLAHGVPPLMGISFGQCMSLVV